MKKMYVAYDVDNPRKVFGCFASREEFKEKMMELWHVKTDDVTWLLCNKNDMESNLYTKVEFEVRLREVEFGKFHEYGI
ncbi:MAG: hypothetical protein ACRCZ0_04245 [Cetobacterium sp.]